MRARRLGVRALALALALPRAAALVPVVALALVPVAALTLAPSLALVWAPAVARAQGADSAAATPADSLGGYLRALADSSDRYFGISGAPVDTAGLDSALVFRLAHPWLSSRVRRSRPSLGPWISFNRVDGPLWGGTVTWDLGVRRARGPHLAGESELGEVGGRLGFIAGPNEWRGGGWYTKGWSAQRDGGAGWTFQASAGRFTAVLDPDRGTSWLRIGRALVNGSDRQHYFRRDGFRASLERATPRWRAGLGFRAELESPLVTTTTWNLLDRVPEVPSNQPASRGRVREVRVEAAARVPGLPLQAEGAYATSRDGLGSDFDYDRFRLALGGDWPLARVAALVPQLEYGRLTGDALPQASFYLGGHHSLRSLPTAAFGGTAKALARLDVFFAPDLLALARVPHPAAVPIQAVLFAGVGTVWGGDPYGGPATADDAWPARDAWRSEVGASLLYRPGIPNPAGSFRLNYAWALGPGGNGHVSLEYAVPLDLLRALE